MNEPETHISKIEAEIIRPLNQENGFFCFMVDKPYYRKLWASDELDEEKISGLKAGDIIRYSAEEDDVGDMIITELEVLNAQ